MALPDIKDVGALAGFVRWGTPNHGLLDGTTLADGGAGVTHPALVSYQQGAGLWITPTIKHVVPGFTPPELPAPAVGNEWLGYGIMSGMYRALYRKNIFNFASAHGYWITSFGAGDSWRCAITSSSVSATSSSGSAAVTVKLTRFGVLESPPVTEEIISLVSDTLAPVGQPLFSGGADDFTASDLKLVALDISPDGQRAILAVMPSIVEYQGYSAPRGLLLLTITKTGAVLSLLKSRSDMLVSVNRVATSESISGGISNADFSCTAPGSVVIPQYNSSSVITTTAVNLVGAYFDAGGTAEFIRCSIEAVESSTSIYDPWTETCAFCTAGEYQSCTIDNQTISSTATFTIAETVTISGVVGAGAIASATSIFQRTGVGSHAAAGGSFTNTLSVSLARSHTSISGRVTSGSQSSPSTISYSAQPENLTPQLTDTVYPGYATDLGSFIRAPYEFTAIGDYPVSCVGFGGLLAHRLFTDSEFSLRHARTGVGGYVSAADSAIISVHPHSGELAKKTGTWTGPPSFGWV